MTMLGSQGIHWIPILATSRSLIASQSFDKFGVDKASNPDDTDDPASTAQKTLLKNINAIKFL